MNVIATYLTSGFINSPKIIGKIHSIFEHAVNVSFEQRLYTFITDNTVGIPDSIVLAPRDFSIFRKLEYGTLLIKKKSNIIIPGSNIFIKLQGNNYDSKFPINCTLASVSERKRRMELICGSELFSNAPPLPSPLKDCFLQLVEMLINQDLDDCEELLCSLIGRGNGLTPSADDVLIGMLAVFSFMIKTRTISTVGYKFLIDFSSVVVRLAETRTTDVSIKYLHCAKQGRFSIPLLACTRSLLDINSNTDMSVFRRLVATGSTSGFDTLAGVLLGIKVIKEYQVVRKSFFGKLSSFLKKS